MSRKKKGLKHQRIFKREEGSEKKKKKFQKKKGLEHGRRMNVIFCV